LSCPEVGAESQARAFAHSRLTMIGATSITQDRNHATSGHRLVLLRRCLLIDPLLRRRLPRPPLQLRSVRCWGFRWCRVRWRLVGRPRTRTVHITRQVRARPWRGVSRLVHPGVGWRHGPTPVRRLVSWLTHVCRRCPAWRCLPARRWSERRELHPKPGAGQVPGERIT
jgi:hypothetical protein